MCYKLIAFLVSTVILVSSSQADQWPQWRGPHSNGVAEGKGYPTQWGPEKNISWKLKLSERGSSTPAVWNEHIFLTGARDNKNLVSCLDRKGKLLWETTIGKARNVRHKKGSSCNPSPATDGKYVFVYFKSGDFSCLDFQGKVVWQKNLQNDFGKDTLWFDLGTSPVLTSNWLSSLASTADPLTWPVLIRRQVSLSGNKIATWMRPRKQPKPIHLPSSYLKRAKKPSSSWALTMSRLMMPPVAKNFGALVTSIPNPIGSFALSLHP